MECAPNLGWEEFQVACARTMQKGMLVVLSLLEVFRCRMAKRGAFLGVISAGQRVINERGGICDGWTVSGTRVLPGYHAERRVCVREGELCTVALRVCMDREEKAVFSCVCSCEDKSHCGVESGDSPGVVSNRFLVSCGAKSAAGGGKRWAGPSFFGLDRADVRTAIDAALLLPPTSQTELISAQGTNSCAHLTHVMSGTGKKKDLVSWVGVASLGELVESPHWVIQYGERFVYLRNGYVARRKVVDATHGAVDIDCSVVMGESDKPVFKCMWTVSGVTEISFSPNANTCVRQVFAKLACETKRAWEYEGLKFFGLLLLKQDRHQGAASKQGSSDTTTTATSSSSRPSDVRERISSLSKAIHRVRRRNAGRASDLAPQHHRRRMELCEDAVDLITFGDVVAFIKHLMKSHPDIVDNALDGTPTYALHLNERLKTQPVPVIVSPDDCGELLAGGHCLSERAYKNTRRILQSKNVHLATYDAAMACLKSLDVGTPVSTGEGHHTECSQCFTWQLKDTLQRVVQVEELFSHFHFPSEQQQQNLFLQLQQRRPDVYKNLDTTRRTIFLRQTGDNYRAALKRQPTQQMSFCILNLQSLVNSPLGQFVVSSWRGGENRSLLRTHMDANFREVEEMAREGITMKVAGAEAVESFNVVVLYVSDFSHSKEVLG